MGEYADNDVSASKARGKGTEWARLLDDIERGHVHVVVAVDLDRLVRSPRDLITLIDLGAKVVTVDGEIDLASADGEFRATMLAAIARFEVRRKSERQRRANEHRAAQGKRIGGRRPFGYEADGVTIRPDEADAVRWAYDAVLAGVSLAAIARDWNARGHVTGQTRQARSGHAGEPSPWRRDSVRAVIMNPRYYGVVRYKGEVVGPAEWEPIVTESTWLAATRVLANPARITAGNRGRSLLSGLAYCKCGATVHAGGNSRKGVRAYRCSGALGHVARKAEPVEEFVGEVVIARLSLPDARSLLRRDTPDTHALQVEAHGIRERLDALAVDFADGALTSSQLRVATERLRARLSDLEGQMADRGRVDLLEPLVGADDVRAVWARLGVERQRAIIHALGMNITLLPPGRGVRTFDPASVSIVWD